YDGDPEVDRPQHEQRAEASLEAIPGIRENLADGHAAPPFRAVSSARPGRLAGTGRRQRTMKRPELQTKKGPCGPLPVVAQAAVSSPGRPAGRRAAAAARRPRTSPS